MQIQGNLGLDWLNLGLVLTPRGLNGINQSKHSLKRPPAFLTGSSLYIELKLTEHSVTVTCARVTLLTYLDSLQHYTLTISLLLLPLCFGM